MKAPNPIRENDSEAIEFSSFSQSDDSSDNWSSKTRSSSSPPSPSPSPFSSLCRTSDSTETLKLQAETTSYTSLRDVLPTMCQTSSWTEIPIRNSLVKRAALAYLQPQATPPELQGQGIFGEFCGDCQCGCSDWIYGVVLGAVRELFGKKRGGPEEEDDDMIMNVD